MVYPSVYKKDRKKYGKNISEIMGLMQLKMRKMKRRIKGLQTKERNQNRMKWFENKRSNETEKVRT